MKRRELEAVVQKHSGRIAKYGEQIPGAFAADDIHELRVEYKKLRAFLRLLQLDPDAGHHLGMPDKVKTMYRSAGAVRDLQLFIPGLLAYTENERITVPAYERQLQQQLFRAKERLVEAIETIHFDKVFEPVLDKLPAYLQDATIRKFIHRKIAAIQIILLAVDKEEELHAIRKHLKDIFYIIRIFENDWGLSFPIAAWRSEKALNEATTSLGDFNDRCIALSLLEEEQLEALPGEEKELLRQWRQVLLQEKEVHQQEVLKQVRALELISNF